MKRDQRGRTRHNGKSKPSRLGAKSSLDPQHVVTIKTTRGRRGHLYHQKAKKTVSGSVESSSAASSAAASESVASTSTVVAQHLKIDDPNIIMVSATTPISKIIKYILTRINSISIINSKRIVDHNTTNSSLLSSSIEQPSLQSIIIAGTNSAIQNVVTIVEILKRRCPSILYNIQIGTVNNTNRIAAAHAAVRCTIDNIDENKKDMNFENKKNQDKEKDNLNFENKKNQNKEKEKDNNSMAQKNDDVTKHVPKHPLIVYGIHVTIIVQEEVQIPID